MNDDNNITIKATDMEGEPISLILKESEAHLLQTIKYSNLFQIVNSSGQTIYTEDSDGTQHWYCPGCGEEIDIPDLHGCEKMKG